MKKHIKNLVIIVLLFAITACDGVFTSNNSSSNSSSADSSSSNSSEMTSSTSSINYYTVSFDKQGGTGGTASISVALNATMSNAIAPVKEGYDFFGYYDDVNGGTQYYDEFMTSVKKWDKSSDATLYARWEIEEYYTPGLRFSLIDGRKEYNVSQGTANVNGVVVIPKKYKGRQVTAIADSAFYKCENLTGIEIPSSVTSIGYSAFSGCEMLTSIEIPNSVTSIGSSAFFYCESLISIEIPNGLTEISRSMFSNCSMLITITFEKGSKLTKIEDSAFSDCKMLTSIEIPNGVTRIGERAFYYCEMLTSIEIPSGLASISDSMFYY